MRPRRGIAVAITVGFVAFVLPILISIQLAWKQSVADEREQGRSYAAEVLRRGEQTAHQFSKTVQLLNHDGFAPCSPQDVDVMRQIDVGSSYIQMVGRISGNTLQCTSLGTQRPIEVGRPTLVTDHGVQERMGFTLGSAQSDQLDLISRDGVAVLVDTRLMIDVETGGRQVALAMLVPSTPQHFRLVESGTFRPEWFNPAGRGRSITYIDNGYVVSQIRSKDMDVAAVSVVPEYYAHRHVMQFAAVFVPIGLLCGTGLAWAVLYVSRVRSNLPALLRAAARHRDFYVEYQPIVDIETRRCVGAEALVRWNRGDTMISPATFITMAEESGVITLVTQSVLQIVARDLPKLLRLDPAFRVSVNLSATDLRSSTTILAIDELLSRSGASPRNVVVEATEHGFVQVSKSSGVLASLKSRGIRLAIDDFGTGYSSLSCLENLDLDILKIDKLFVDTIGTDGATSQVVSHIIDMAHALNLRVIAEGVETEAQARFLAKRGVEFAQGWLFGKAVDIDTLCDQVEHTLRENYITHTT